MLRKTAAFIDRLPPVPRALGGAFIAGGLTIGGLHLADAFSRATGLDRIVERFWEPLTNPVMYHLMRGIEGAEGDNPPKQPDIPGRDFI